MLCFEQDDFIAEKTIWIATLSDGRTVYQDDGRLGEDPPQAWLRLAEYVKLNNLWIKSLKLQFRSHIEDAAPANAAGYYYSQAIEAFMLAKRNLSYYIIGSVQVDSPVLHCTKWLIPEILPTEHSTRPIPLGDEKLILKPGVNLGKGT